MSGDTKVPPEALGDTEATLRQVEGVLGDFDSSDHHLERVDRMMDDIEARPTGLKDLVSTLVKTYSETMVVIDSLRKSRGLLEAAAMDRLKSTHQKLAEVSSATEVAATGMLDGLDRALVLVDQMEAESASTNSDSETMAEHREGLRDELHTLMGLLQFQDITSQQLGHTSTVLRDIEDRLVRLAEIFDMRDMGLEDIAGQFTDGVGSVPESEPEPGPEVVPNDPGASTLDAEGRQAVADSIFG